VDRWDNPNFERWLQGLPDDAATEVRSAIEYLLEHGRGAQLDLVRHRIQISSHYPDMSEVRVLFPAKPTDLVLRILTCFVNDDKMLLVLVAGDKALWARTKQADWYDTHVPIADAITTHYLANNPPKR
jgi:hypothetical protein